MTIATMGRRMKKSAITLTPCRAWPRVPWRARLLAAGGGLGHLRGGHRLHRRAFAHLLQALDHDAFTGLETLPGSAGSRRSGSPTLTARWVALLSEPMTHTKFLPCSSATARSGTRMLSGRTPRSTLIRANIPGRSSLLGIGKLGAHPQGAGLHVHGAVNEHESCPCRGCAEPFARIRVTGRSATFLPVRRLSAFGPEVLHFAHVAVEPDGIERGDRGQQRRLRPCPPVRRWTPAWRRSGR